MTRKITTGSVRKDIIVVVTIINAASDSSRWNFEAISRDRTIVGIAPSITHDSKAVPSSLKICADPYAIKGTSASLIIRAGTISEACLTGGKVRARPILKIIRGTTTRPSISRACKTKPGTWKSTRFKTNTRE